MKINHGTTQLLSASVTANEVSDEANVAAYQRKSLQLVGAGSAIVETTLDGTNWVPVHSGLDDANGTVTAGKVYQLPIALRHIRVTKSNDANEVTVILFAEGFDAV